MKKCSSIIKVAATLLLSATVLFTGCTALSDGISGGEIETSGARTFLSSSKRNVIYVSPSKLSEIDPTYYSHICVHFLTNKSSDSTIVYNDSKYNDNGSYTSIKNNVSSIKSALDKVRAKNKNVKILISYAGGDDGSKAASSVLKNRPSQYDKNGSVYKWLVSNIANFTVYAGFDGVDFDWEYFSGYSTYNPVYPGFVADVKNKIGRLDPNNKSKYIYTIAVQTESDFYKNSDIKTMLKNEFNFINVMNYDYNTSSSKIGSTGSFSRTAETIDAYINTVGLSASKLNVGLPYYGYAYKNKSDWYLGGSGTRVTKSNGDSYKPKYREIINNKNSDIHHVSETYNGTTLSTVAYCTGKDSYYSGTTLYIFDDATTVANKIKWAVGTRKCGGAMAWEYSYDSNKALQRAVVNTLNSY